MNRASLGVLLLALAAPAFSLKIERITRPAVAGGGPAPVMEVVAEQVLVQFSSGSTHAQRAAILSTGGGREEAELPVSGWKVVSMPPGTHVADAISALMGRPGVVSIQPNHVYHLTKTPNDPLVSSQYALAQIDAFGGWEYEVGNSTTVTIALIDAGISPVPELASKIISLPPIRSQFFDPDSGGAQSVDDPPTPACNHATRTAGVAAAVTDNGAGTAGVSWGAKLISLKVFNDADCNPTGDCPGTCNTTDAAMANAMNYAASLQGQPGVNKVVISMSIGASGGACPGVCPGMFCFAASRDAIAVSTTAGIPVIISAGNDASAVNAPANCATATPGTGVIPAGATDSGNNIAFFSSRGPELGANGVVAPGVQVLTSDLGGGNASASGTSFSAPHIAGLAALILAAKPGCNNQNCATYVQSIIRAGAERIGPSSLGAQGVGAGVLGDTQGAGRINVFRSLRLAVNGTLAGFAGEEKPIAFPNPFHVSRDGNVSFAIPPSLQGSNPVIKIYTIAGEMVRELSGLAWDGRNTAGNMVASGTYVFLVKTGAGVARGRVAVIR